jgi:hypothetical protein
MVDDRHYNWEPNESSLLKKLITFNVFTVTSCIKITQIFYDYYLLPFRS